MARGSRGGRHAAVDGEYERDEIARNTQLEARCQRMEELQYLCVIDSASTHLRCITILTLYYCCMWMIYLLQGLALRRLII